MIEQKNDSSLLLLVTHGTYSHHDDGMSALLMDNAYLAFQERATIVLLDDGVYMAVKGQDPSSLGLPGYLKYVNDILDLKGRIIALQESLESRGIRKEQLVDRVEVINTEGLCQEIKNHRATVTF